MVADTWVIFLQSRISQIMKKNANHCWLNIGYYTSSILIGPLIKKVFLLRYTKSKNEFNIYKSLEKKKTEKMIELISNMIL